MSPDDANAVFKRLLPPGTAVFAAEVATFAPDASLENAVPERRREFAAGRHCATQALLELGITATPGRDAKTREPLWPSGIAGSITHSRALAAAAVGKVLALGIDLEPKLSDDALRDVRALAISDLEFELLGKDIGLATVLFSAKESLFKALWPSTHVFLDFPDATLVSMDAQTLTLKTASQQHRVRYAFEHGHAFTVCTG